MYRYLFLTAFVMASPILLHAASGLVPCGFDENDPSDACQACHTVALVENIVTWLAIVMGIIAILIIVYGGIRIVTSLGNPQSMKTAKTLIYNAIIGFIIILGCWFIIGFIMRAFLLGDGDVYNFGPWRSIQCVAQPVVAAPDTTYDVIENISYGRYGLTQAPPPGAPAGAFAPGTGAGDQASCTVAGSGPCSAAALSSAGFGSMAADASRIAGAESGCNSNAESRTDTTTDGRTYSVGTWQINLSVHSLSCNGQTLDCPSAFRNTGTRNQYNVREKEVINESLYQQCVQLAKNPECNNQKAAQLAQNSGDLGDWACSARKCGVNTSRNHLCPL